MLGSGRRQRAWRAVWLGAALVAGLGGCGPLETAAQGFGGPSEVVGRNAQWFLDNIGEPCAKELNALGGEVWLYAQEADRVDLLECGTPGVLRSWAVYFTSGVCTAAMSLDRPPR